MKVCKQIRIAALLAGCLLFMERGCHTIEALHTLDFILHVEESPTLAEVERVLATRQALVLLLAALVGFLSLLVRVSRPRQSSTFGAAAVEPTLTDRIAEVDERPRRKRTITIIEEREEVHRTRIVRSVIHDGD